MLRIINKHWMVPALLLFAFTACEPQVTSAPDLPSAPQSDNVTFEYEPNAENPNIIQFVNTSDSFKAQWDFGNGSTAEGDTVIGEFPLKGDYTITLTIFTQSGQAMNTQDITIAETNALMLDDPDLNLITGGAEQVEGKTWVIDSTQTGHMGVGPPESTGPEWWSAPPNAKPGTGLYTDEYTFTLDGLQYEQQTNGRIFIQGNNASDFDGAVEAPGGDMMASWTAPEDLTFNFNKEDDGSMYLQVSDPGFIGFYTGVRTYEILELSENLMILRFEDSNDDQVWYHRLIPKGYTYPPIELPYQSEHLIDTFDEDGNVSWILDQVTDFNESYDNPAPVGVNTSAKVAKYTKGEGQAHFYDNVYLDLGYDINLNERSTVRLKAYMPAYNDYETEDPNAPSWSPYTSLTMQVSVKLQDTQIDQPFTTQAEVIQPVNQTDTWVELEFDFSGYSDREDFDRIVVQIGGEAHGMPGIFFIDDFELVE